MFTVQQISILVEQILKVSQSRHMSGVKTVLKRLCKLCGADGSVLWMWTQQEPPERSRLFAAAVDFVDQKDLFWHCLLPDSPSTRVARAGIPRNFCELPVLPGDPDYEEMRRLGVRSFCAVPVCWPGTGDGEVSIGTVNFYRCQRDPFSGNDFEMAKALAKLVPEALSVILNHASFHLLRQVADRLGAAHVAEDDPKVFGPDLENALDPVLKEVLDSFNCLEASIYLIRPQEADRRLHKVVTEWPWKDRAQPLSYRQGEGLTGYCARFRRPVCIFDLARFDEDVDFIDGEYPGIRWSRPFDFEAAVREELNQAGKLQPLSFLAAPIIDGRQTLGVLRCCVAKSEPYYFNKRQLDLLCLVAGLLGQWCGDLFQLKSVAERREWLQTYVQGISELNSRAHDAMMTHRPDFESLFQEALEVAQKALPQAAGLAIHLTDSAQKSLQYRAAVGAAWKEGSPAEVKHRKAALLPLDAGDSAPADAFTRNKIVRIHDLESSTYKCTLFPPTKSLVVAPISSGSKKYGVLSAIFKEGDSYLNQAAAVVELLGLQLGLYRVLGDNLADLRATKEDSEKKAEIELQTFENLQHQLKIPIFLAHRWVRVLAGRQRLVDSVPEILHLKSQIRRAEQIVANLRMFADLARGSPVQTNRKVVRMAAVVDRLAEAARDHNLVIDPDRHIQFVVDGKSFLTLDDVIVSIDLQLMDQMVDCLLDNAGKYSDPNSSVAVRGGLAQKAQLFNISVLNKGRGTPVSPQQARTLAERGTRGDRALWQKKEGWGLGLYIVREILAAHGGRLEIIPTTENYVTEFRLAFPTGSQ